MARLQRKAGRARHRARARRSRSAARPRCAWPRSSRPWARPSTTATRAAGAWPRWPRRWRRRARPAKRPRSRTSEAKSVLAALRERAAATEAECRRLRAGPPRPDSARIAAAEQRAAEHGRAPRGAAARRWRRRSACSPRRLAARERVAGEAAVAEDRVRDLRNELEGREAGLKERRRERDMLRDALSELEVARARTGSDLDHLGRECHQAVGHDGGGGGRAHHRRGPARRTSPALEAQVQEMRERLDRMGPVNVLAVEQSQELEERSTVPDRAAPGPARLDRRAGPGHQEDRPRVAASASRRPSRSSTSTSARSSGSSSAAAPPACR